MILDYFLAGSWITLATSTYWNFLFEICSRLEKHERLSGCVCLEVKQCGWKTLERKWERKLFWSVFGWVRRKENKWWGPNVFFLGLPKYFIPKIERKLSGDAFFLDWQKCPCACAYAHGFYPVAFFFFYTFFFFWFSRAWAWLLFFLFVKC